MTTRKQLSTKIAMTMAVLAGSLCGQRGDHAGEEQPPLPSDLKVPEAPVLDPQAALGSLHLAAGFRVELVAAEPLVQDPICMTFDADGRIWAVEMRSFMPNVDGEGELEPTSRVVVLEDDDGDGRMDRSRVFLDQLVLPRALALVDGGLLLIEPPNMWFHRDSDGDGRADTKELIAEGFGAGLENPEHAANSLLHGLDNWIYMANHPLRLRRRPDGTWLQEPTLSSGQWGLSMDDRGRLFFNYNSDFLRSNLYPAHYGRRHPQQSRPTGLNQQVIKDQSLWPIRVTPGVNRGYQEGMLRDGFLTRSTAVCGPVIYRGDLFPEEFRGNAFICEPAGNLVRRLILREEPGRISGENPYEKAEFLSSTDERFRPVNLYNGPDGALYVVDMYRGIIQHRNFVTSFLRKQIIERGLEAPLGLGRIWRIVPETHERRSPRKLAASSSDELVDMLASKNGWIRDQAQLLLAERRDPKAATLLRELLAGGASTRTRIHALWTLEGMAALRRADVFVALHDPDAKLRATGLRLAEPYLRARSEPMLWALLDQIAMAEDEDLTLQFALSLGEVQNEKAVAQLAKIAAEHSEKPIIRRAVLSGLYQRELEFLSSFGQVEDSPGKRAVLRQLSRFVTAERNGELVAATLDQISQRKTIWQRRAMLQGMVDALPKPGSRADFLRLRSSPPALAILSQDTDERVQALLAELLQSIAIIPDTPASSEDDDLVGTQLASFRAGSKLFAVHCAVCHQVDGRGMDGLAPPLRNSEWVLGNPDLGIRILLHGLVGPIQVDGRSFDLSMPGHNRLNDEQIAGILTYIRRVWNHRADPVSPGQVSSMRAATKTRENQWTATELERLR